MKSTPSFIIHTALLWRPSHFQRRSLPTAVDRRQAGQSKLKGLTLSRGKYARFTLVGKFLKSPPGDNAIESALLWSWTVALTIGLTSPSCWRGSLVVGDPLKIDWVEPEQIEVMSYYPKVAVVYRPERRQGRIKKIGRPEQMETSASFPKTSAEKILRAQTLEITAKEQPRIPGHHAIWESPDPTSVEQTCDVEVHKIESFKKVACRSLLTIRSDDPSLAGSCSTARIRTWIRVP